MQAHSKLIKERRPGAATVFIGPCISKKAEADASEGLVDCVLTFEELSAWLAQEKIALEDTGENAENSARGERANFFPTSGGIIRSMDTEGQRLRLHCRGWCGKLHGSNQRNYSGRVGKLFCGDVRL